MKRFRPYVLLAVALLLLLSLPKGVVSRIRAAFVFGRRTPQTEGISIARLERENALLKEMFVTLARTPPPSHSALPARVLFRGANSWNSSLWINVGAREGVEKDSPVIFGNSVVGVVDEVLSKKSRVRLLTDARLHPSVRSSREGHLLAKGELAGSSGPLWRRQSKLLRGSGFNYDHPDSAGLARDLRSNPPLILPGDLLITTGMDGIFPPGLEVARVVDVDLLREGAISYSLTAKPVVETLDDLDLVFVLQTDDFADDDRH